jgi:[acyl-carrier-protein] S-malonyltransferase
MTDSANLIGLFPGQGAIRPAVGQAWKRCSAWDIVSDLSDVAHVDIAQLLLDADLDTLVSTENAQLATFALSMVGWQHYLLTHEPPAFVAGHSLGEFSAYVAAGVLGLDDACRVVIARGRAMALAARRNDGSMAALMGGSDDALDRVLSLDDVWLANDNGGGQYVVSGTAEAIAGLISSARENGWKRATPLLVGGAFHSPLMIDAQPELDAALESASWKPAQRWIASNVDGAWHFGESDFLLRAKAQMTSPVRFESMISSAPVEVVNSVEFPPGSVLSGLVKRIRAMDQISSVEEPA